MDTSEFWSRNWRFWPHYGSPLRPCARDIEIYDELLQEQLHLAKPRPVRALVLGVTPELAQLAWPSSTRLSAADRSPQMIQHVWPRQLAHAADVACSEWTDLPFSDESFHLLLGDGCFNQMTFPGGLRDLVKEIARLLVPGGALIVRAFVSPDDRETPQQVFDDLAQGRIGSFHVFKWRLNMAMQESSHQGVSLGDVWRAVATQVPSRDDLAERCGFPRQEVDTIDSYRDSAARFFYPTLSELRRAWHGELAEIQCVYPSYELGERCPILLLRH